MAEVDYSKQNYRQLSRLNWATDTSHGNLNGMPTDEMLQIGCLQRIADALEKPNTALLTKLMHENNDLRDKVYRLEKQIRGLKKQLKELIKQ